MARKSITDQQLLDGLRWMEQAIGQVSQKEYCRRMKVSEDLLRGRFGSWLVMRARAGLTPVRLKPHCRIQPGELLDALRCAAENNPSIKQYDFCRLVGVSQTTILRNFGSWNSMRQRIGLPPARRGTAKPFTREEVIAELRRQVAEFGNQISSFDFYRRAPFGVAVVGRLFGSWTALQQSQGLKSTRKRLKISIHRLMEDLRRLEEKLRYFPSFDEIARYSRYSIATYQRRFVHVWRIEIAYERHMLYRECQRRFDHLINDAPDEYYTREPREDVRMKANGEMPANVIKRKRGRFQRNRYIPDMNGAL